MKKRKSNWQKKYGTIMSKAIKIDDSELLVLKGIVDEHPKFYLDEVALAFMIKTGKCIHFSTLWNYITKRLGYSLQMIISSAKQQCEVEKDRYMVALGIMSQGDAECLITIDETHEECSSAKERMGKKKCR